MKNDRSLMARRGGVFLALMLAFAGCLNVKPVVDSARFFVLAPAVDPAAGPLAPKTNFTVGLARVELPDYLQPRRLAVRQSQNEIHYFDNLHWGERLDRGIQRALGGSLAMLLGPGNAVLPVWRRGDVRAEVYVSVQRFECDAQGRAMLEASWRITSPGADTILRDGRSKIIRPGPPPATDPNGAVASLAGALGELAREIAIALETLPPAPTR